MGQLHKRTNIMVVVVILSLSFFNFKYLTFTSTSIEILLGSLGVPVPNINNSTGNNVLDHKDKIGVAKRVIEHKRFILKI